MILEINISFCKIIWGPSKSDKNNYYHWVKLEKSLFGQQTLLLPQANSLICVLNLTSSHLFSDFNSASVPFLFCVINIPVFIWSFLLHTNGLFCFSSKKNQKQNSNPRFLYDITSLLYFTTKLLTELTPLISYLLCPVSSECISIRLPHMTLLKHFLSSSSMSSLMLNAMDNVWSSSYFAFFRVSYN